MEPTPPALEGEILTTGPLGQSCYLYFRQVFTQQIFMEGLPNAGSGLTVRIQDVEKKWSGPGSWWGLHKVKSVASTQPGVICGLTNGSELMEKNQASEGERCMGREARASCRVFMEGPTKEMAGLKLKKVEGGARQIPGP